MNKRFKKVRHELRLTQEQFGRRLGLKWSQVKDIETGVVRMRPMLIRLLYHEFLINTEWLITGKGSMFNTAEAEARHKGFEADYCRKLMKILTDGDGATVNALKQTIDVFHGTLLEETAKNKRKKN